MFTLYDFDGFAPNPFVVTMFAREKGVPFERRTVDVVNRENRRMPYLTQVNPLGEVPAAHFGEGRMLTEVIAICEYLEELVPNPPLIGATPWERAEVRMWTRRLDLKICEPMGEAFAIGPGRSFFASDGTGEELPKAMLPVETAAAMRANVDSKLLWLDRQVEGRTWICGDQFTLADIMLYSFIKFGTKIGHLVPAEANWVHDHFVRADARDSAWRD